jgi:hypothetical protein
MRPTVSWSTADGRLDLELSPGLADISFRRQAYTGLTRVEIWSNTTATALSRPLAETSAARRPPPPIPRTVDLAILKV